MAKLLKAKKHVQSGSPEEEQELAKFQNAIANVNAVISSSDMSS
mgnify:CR=1 FL=1